MIRLEELRKEKKMNMVKCAAQLQVPYTTYVSWEKGEREPNSEWLITLANFFGCSIDYLVGRSSERVNKDIQPYKMSSSKKGAVVEAEIKEKSPREFATREDAIKHYQQDLTKEEFKELEMFADFLRYRRGHQP